MLLSLWKAIKTGGNGLIFYRNKTLTRFNHYVNSDGLFREFQNDSSQYPERKIEVLPLKDGPMSYEEIKKLIIENAWFDFNVDYGLLHLQLATPVLVFFLLMFVLFMMNKLLFQPVFRTLDNRQKIAETSKTQTASIRVEILKLRQEYEEQLNAARAEVNRTYFEKRVKTNWKKEKRH